MSLIALMEGIEARLATIAGLRTSDIKPDNITPPAAIVGVPPIESYEDAFARGRATLRPTVTVLVSAALDRTGQHRLARYASLSGPESIFAAINGDSTLDGAAEDCRVVSFRPLGMEEVGRINYYGGLFVLEVMVRE